MTPSLLVERVSSFSKCLCVEYGRNKTKPENGQEVLRRRKTGRGDYPREVAEQAATAGPGLIGREHRARTLGTT